MILAITGGGTGGHVSPGLAVATVWQKRHGKESVFWAGRPGGIEERMTAAAGIRFLGVDSAGLIRAGAGSAPLRALGLNLAMPFRLARGLWQAFRLLLKEKPSVVLMTGGFAGAPLALACGLLGRPLVLLEPNAAMGLANRFFKGAAGAVCLSFPLEGAGTHTVLTGNPVRLGARLPSKPAARRAFGLGAKDPVLLVMPGSASAQSVTKALAAALPRLEKVQLLWMTGEAMLKEAEKALERSGLEGKAMAFISDVASAYAAADLVLARSGASMVAEIACAGKPSLLVPYPHASGDHQRKNALFLVEAGAARLLMDHELSGERLARELAALLGDPKRLAGMSRAAKKMGRPHAATEVASVAQRVARGFEHV